MQDRVKHLAQKPHIAALNMGSMNYAKWNAEKQQFAFNFVFQNSFDDIVAFARAMKDHGVKPEMECFDTPVLSYHELMQTIRLDVRERIPLPGKGLKLAA